MKTKLIDFKMLWGMVESRHVTRSGPVYWTIYKDTPDLGHAWAWIEYQPNHACFVLHGEKAELTVWERGPKKFWRFKATSKGMSARHFKGLPFGPLTQEGEVYLPGSVRVGQKIRIVCPKDGHLAWERRRVNGLPSCFEIAAESVRVSTQPTTFFDGNLTFDISVEPGRTTCTGSLQVKDYPPYDGLLQHGRPGNKTPREAVEYLYKSCFGDAEVFEKMYRQVAEVYGGMTTKAETEGIDLHASVLAHSEDGGPPQNNVSIWLADKRCPGRTVIVKLLTRLGRFSGAAKASEPSVHSWVEVVNDDGRIIDREGMPQSLNNVTDKIGDKRQGAKAYIANALAWMDEHAAMACLPLA